MDEYEKMAVFFDKAISEIAGFNAPDQVKILDFGTGSGNLVNALNAHHYDAYGCDVEPYWENAPHIDKRKLSLINLKPYRLPYEDESFDVILSTSVLEHAQNKEEVFNEFHRVLKKNGVSMHMFPSKWYLPIEPHIHVPLLNYFSPGIPQWWLKLWALLGIRNEFQQGYSWRETVAANNEFCRKMIAYWPNSQYRVLSMKIFGNYSNPMRFYIDHSYGGVPALLRKLPFKNFTGWLSGHLRTTLILQRKDG